MIKLVRHSTRLAASLKHLSRRVVYLEDQEHRNHKGKEIVCARNYRCGHASSDFIKEVLRLDASYQHARKGLSGRPGRRLFEEIVYSSPKNVWMDERERSQIESTIVRLVAPNTTCRTAWHLDSVTGRADMHLLLAARTQDDPPSTTLWGRFKGAKHIFVEFERCDLRIAAILNLRTSRPSVKTARQVRKAKYASQTMASNLAQVASESVTAENLSELITKAGHKVISQTERTICIIFKGRKRSLRYNSAKLVEETNKEFNNPERDQEPPKDFDSI